jgi:hypothetical protein
MRGVTARELENGLTPCVNTSSPFLLCWFRTVSS